MKTWKGVNVISRPYSVHSLKNPFCCRHSDPRVKYSNRAYVVVLLKKKLASEPSDSSSQHSAKRRNIRTWFQKLTKNKDTPAPADPTAHIKSLFHEFSLLHDSLQSSGGYDFQRALATRNYYRALIEAGINAVEHGGSALQPEIRDMRAQLAQQEHDIQSLHQRNKCQILLESSTHCLEYPAPHLFIILPTDLEYWKDLDATTHSFRLYFLCDSRSSLTSNLQPQHIHVLEHQGYDLLKPQEFFQQFGQYALTILTMVKDGFSRSAYSVPSLDTFRILDRCRGISARHSLSQNNIVTLVDKAIRYLQVLNLATASSWNVFLDPLKTRQIASFLQLESFDNELGGLQRTFYDALGTPVRWLCPAHSFEYASTRALDVFVQLQEGEIDRQLGTIQIQLSSVSQVRTFVTALRMQNTYSILVSDSLGHCAKASCK